jgi:hypothetical protein
MGVFLSIIVNRASETRRYGIQVWRLELARGLNLWVFSLSIIVNCASETRRYGVQVWRLELARGLNFIGMFL